MKKQQIENEQITLGLSEPSSNKIVGIKRKISDRFRYFETKRFIKSPYSWLTVLVSISLLAVQLFYCLRYLHQLPTTIPIYSNSIDLSVRLANHNALYVFPSLSFIILVVTITSGYKLYNTRKELINFSLINMSANIAILTFIFLRIFSTYS